MTRQIDIAPTASGSWTVQAIDGNIAYDAETVATLAEAREAAKIVAADLDWGDYDVSIDH